MQNPTEGCDCATSGILPVISGDTGTTLADLALYLLLGYYGGSVRKITAFLSVSSLLPLLVVQPIYIIQL